MDQVYGTAGNVKKKTHLTRGLPKPDTQIEVEMRDQEPVMNGRREASMMSTEHFKAIIDCIGDPIFVKDRRYRYVFMNDAACEMFGIPREPSLGKTDYESFQRDMRMSSGSMIAASSRQEKNTSMKSRLPMRKVVSAQ